MEQNEDTAPQREKAKSFRALDVWKLGMEIVVDVYHLTELFPKEEAYGLTSQMRRAAVSVPSNIAEGFNRAHSGEYKQFLHVSLGSCAELETQTELVMRLGYVTDLQSRALLEQLDHESRMLMNLAKRLGK